MKSTLKYGLSFRLHLTLAKPVQRDGNDKAIFTLKFTQPVALSHLR